MSATAFAPATCGNVCVGYDIMGLCYEGVGDTITVSKLESKVVIIESITGNIAGVNGLPVEADQNTAGVVLLELIKQEKLTFGFSIKIEKGISIGSGMGGSAACAVGALVAANSLLENPISKEKLLVYSLKGEELACGFGHADNTAPCLFGGLVLLSGEQVIQLPFPKDIHLLLIHPELIVKTSEARKAVRGLIPISDVIKQSQNLAGFISGCYNSDKELIKKSFEDVLVEPGRSKLTIGYLEAKSFSQELNAIGYTLSGSGPSQLALCESQDQAKLLQSKIQEFYLDKNIEVDFYLGKINLEGTKLI